MKLRRAFFHAIAVDDFQAGVQKMIDAFRETGDPELFKALAPYCLKKAEQDINIGAQDGKYAVFTFAIGDRQLNEDQDSAVPQTAALPQATGVRELPGEVHGSRGEHENGKNGRVSGLVA